MVILVGATRAIAAEDPKVMLDEARKSLAVPNKVKMSWDTTITWRAEFANESGTSIERVKYSINDGQVSIEGSTWDLLTPDAVMQPGEETISRKLFDGNALYLYRERADGSGRWLSILSEEHLKGNLSNERHMTIFGYAPGDFRHLVSILAEDDPGIAIERTEELIILRSTNAHGKMEVWLDPKRGHSMVRARIEKEADSYWYGERLDDEMQLSDQRKALTSPTAWLPKQRLVYELFDVRLRQIGNRWIPAEGSSRITTDYGDGRIAERVNHAVLREIDLNPRFEQGTFEPNFPEGTRGFHHVAPNTPMRWSKGGPEPDADLMPNR